MDVIAESLNIRVRHQPGHVLVTVAGDIDIATVGELRARLTEAAAAGLPLVIDLDQVTFIDATGLGALVGAARRAAARGASLHAVCARPWTRNLLRLTGLDRRLGLCRSRAEAASSLSRAGLGSWTDAGRAQAPAALAKSA